MLELLQVVATSSGEWAGKLIESVTLRAQYSSGHADVHKGGETDHMG